MKHSVTLIHQTTTYDGKPIHLKSIFDFSTMHEACEYVDDCRREGEAGDVIKRYTNETLIEQWTIR